MYNIGLIGYGYWGPNFARVVNQHDSCNLAYICDQDEQKQNLAKKTYPDTKIISSYDLILNDDKVDAVIVSTPLNTHFDIVKDVLAAGKNILCEKPASMSFKELVEVKNKMIEKNVRFYEAISYYSHPQTIDILNLIENDEIGEIQKIECNFGFKAKFNPKSRLFNPKLGGGAIYDLGCYPISFAMLFSKKPNSIKIENKKNKFCRFKS